MKCLHPRFTSLLFEMCLFIGDRTTAPADSSTDCAAVARYYSAQMDDNSFVGVVAKVVVAAAVAVVVAFVDEDGKEVAKSVVSSEIQYIILITYKNYNIKYHTISSSLCGANPGGIRVGVHGNSGGDHGSQTDDDPHK